MLFPDHLEMRNGFCRYRPEGEHSLVEAVDLIAEAVAHCRVHRMNRLLIDTRGLIGIPVPTLVDRFLMVEEWAERAEGIVVVVMVADADYIHPKKFGVRVAAHFGLLCEVFTSEEEARAWLMQESHLAPAGPT